MTHYVYAGVPQWSSTEDSEPLGGLFRQEMGESKWRHLSKGLPDKAEVEPLPSILTTPADCVCGHAAGPLLQHGQWRTLATPRYPRSWDDRVVDYLSPAQSADPLPGYSTDCDLLQ